jgi:hypothetical protein
MTTSKVTDQAIVVDTGLISLNPVAMRTTSRAFAWYGEAVKIIIFP